MKREGRLSSARHWMPVGLSVFQLVRRYARWYGVDQLCAAKELAMLGVEISSSELEAIRRAYDARVAGARRRRERRQREEETQRHEIFSWLASDLPWGWEGEQDQTEQPCGDFPVFEFD
ncbi:MAG: hypothetical protein R3B99_08185 [Polyangiales bacterium]